jgi:hypothetical protein
LSFELNFPFTTPSNYTFNTDKIEVTGGVAKLKDQRPGNATFHANYNSNINGNWGGGTLTGNAVGGASVSGGKLDLKGGTVQYVDYNADLNADSQQVGTIRFKLTPNYSGTPAGSRAIFNISKAAGDNDNTIYLYHSVIGPLYLTIIDSTGAYILNTANLGGWSPVLGTEYEFELNWDITTGATRLFIDGVQKGSTQTATGTRDSGIGLLRIGGNLSGTVTSDCEINDLIIFSTVQHTANYTPGESIPATIYDIANPTIEGNASWRNEGLDGFTETSTKPGSDEIKYILKKNGSFYYWTGSAWAVSNETYSQANDAATIETNKATFTTVQSNSKFRAFLHSVDGSTTPELDNLEILYNYSGDPSDELNTCIVWGYTKDIFGNAITDPIYIYPNLNVVEYKTNTQILYNKETITPDSNGYWEAELIVTDDSSMTPTPQYVFEIDGVSFTKSIPNEVSVNFNDL